MKLWEDRDFLYLVLDAQSNVLDETPYLVMQDYLDDFFASINLPSDATTPKKVIQYFLHNECRIVHTRSSDGRLRFGVIEVCGGIFSREFRSLQQLFRFNESFSRSSADNYSTLFYLMTRRHVDLKRFQRHKPGIADIFHCFTPEEDFLLRTEGYGDYGPCTEICRHDDRNIGFRQSSPAVFTHPD